MKLAPAAALAALTACGSPHANVPTRFVNTGDPLPDRPGAPAAECPAHAESATRWIDSDPHTPFFVTDADGVHEAGRACCATWAARGTRWHTIGAYGEITGEAELVGGEGYDVTQCYELAFEQRSGSAGVGIYASAGGGYRPGRSARWTPSASEREALGHFVDDLERLVLPDLPDWASSGPSVLPLSERVLFFAVDRAAIDGTSRVVHYAIIGGRMLAIAYLDPAGRWVASYLDVSLNSNARAYRPLAVLDVDGDGVPEVIVHWDAADSWSDDLLRFDGEGWERVARSVGGSTA